MYADKWHFIPNKEYPIFGFRELLKGLKSGELII